jgi:hypothetical protein
MDTISVIDGCRQASTRALLDFRSCFQSADRQLRLPTTEPRCLDHDSLPLPSAVRSGRWMISGNLQLAVGQTVVRLPSGLTEVLRTWPRRRDSHVDAKSQDLKSLTLEFCRATTMAGRVVSLLSNRHDAAAITMLPWPAAANESIDHQSKPAVDPSAL